MEDRANEEGGRVAFTEASDLAMRLVRAPITGVSDLALMAHSLLQLEAACRDRWNVLRERLAKFV